MARSPTGQGGTSPERMFRRFRAHFHVRKCSARPGTSRKDFAGKLGRRWETALLTISAVGTVRAKIVSRILKIVSCGTCKVSCGRESFRAALFPSVRLKFNPCGRWAVPCEPTLGSCGQKPICAAQSRFVRILWRFHAKFRRNPTGKVKLFLGGTSPFAGFAVPDSAPAGSSQPRSGAESL